MSFVGSVFGRFGRRWSGLLLAAAVGFPVFASDGSAEIELLKRENTELRRRLELSEARFRQLRLWMGELSDRAEVTGTVRREERLLRIADKLSRSGGELALKAVEVGDELGRALRDSGLGAARQAQLSLRLDELQSEARRFIALSSDSPAASDGLNSCRVLSVNGELNLVALSAGSDHGVFPGAVYRAEAEDKPVRLLVVGVRPGASAALILNGRASDLLPGMRLTAARESESVRSVVLPGIDTRSRRIPRP